MLKSCPDPQDVQDLQFKLQCRLKVFENTDLSTFPTTHNLLSCASRYGLLFVGSNSNSFQVIQTNILHSYSPKDKDVSIYPRRIVEIPSWPKHLCVNCDSTILSVVIEKDQCPVVVFYDVLSFLSRNIKVVNEIRLSSTPNVFVREVNWNPSLPGIFTTCKSDGSLVAIELNGKLFGLHDLPASAGVTSFCWSPKGKQIAVGSIDGKITQYKPDLKPVKVINAPPLEGPHSLICLQWVSNFQFVGAYQSANPEGAACVILVDAPKIGETGYTNYEDVCYSGSTRMPQFYFSLQQTWNFLMVASANSTEVGVLGAEGDKWTQWIIQDSARAELPLGSDHQETLPVGFGVDISSTVPLPWGESQIPPCPTLLVLSHQGILCCFNVVYLRNGVPTVCTPPDNVPDTSGLACFVQESPKPTPEPIQAPVSRELPKPAQPSAQPVVTSVKPIQTGQPSLFGGTATSNQQPLFGGQPLARPLFDAQPVQPQKPGASLFGGQTTLTTTKPFSVPEGSLFAGQATITPISKAATSNFTVPTTEEKYSKIFSTMQTTTAATTLPSQPAVVIKTDSKLPKKDDGLTFQSSSQAATPEASISKSDPPITDPKIKAETNAMLTHMIQDECTYLESELKAILHQTKLLNINVSSDQEKTRMVTDLNSLDEFIKEVVDITSGQNSEIHCLKQNLIQAWALYEEASSLYNASKDETLNILLKAQPLDSLAEKRLNDIKQIIYYVDSQLSQTNKALDSQWDSFQDYAKKNYRVKMPTMEAIFQTMVRQNAVLQKQTYVLKDISMRLKKKNTATNLSLLRLNEKHQDVADDLSRLHLNSHDILQLQYDKVLNQLNSLSETKTEKLRHLLKKKPVTHVTAVIPNLSSWTINHSPSKTKQMISMLGAHMSPVSKPIVARTLDFVQSTPMKPETKFPPTSLVGLSTPVPFKNNDKAFATNQNTFLGLGSKPGSAFVPTSQKSTGFIAISSAQSSATNLFNPSSSTTFTSAQKPSFSVQMPKPTEQFVKPPTVSFGALNIPSSQAHVIVVDPFKKSESRADTTKPASSAATSNLTFSFGPNKIPTTSSIGFAPADKGQPMFGGTSSLLSALTSNTASVKPEQARTLGSSAVFKPETIKSTAGIGQTTTQSTAADLTKPATSKSTLNLTSSTTISSKESKPSENNPNLFTSEVSVAKPLFNVQTSTETKNIQQQLTSTATSTSASATFSFGNKTICSTTTTTSVPTTGTSSIFGTASKGSLFGIPKDDTTATKAQSLFGSTEVSTAQSLFGAASSQGSIFGTSAVASSTISDKPSLFGTPASTSSNIFGTTTTTSSSESTAKPMFGVPTTSASANIFATAASSAAATTSASVFGGVTATSGSIFGAAAKTTAASENANPSVTTVAANRESVGALTTTTSIFGTSVTSSTSSVPTTPTNLFASSAATTSQSSIFGSVPAVASSTQSGSTSTNIFGAPSSTAQSGSIFGGSTAATTGSNIFGTSTASTTASSIFGGQTAGASSAPSVFGTSTSSVFGSAAPSSSIFGAGTPTTEASSTVGNFGPASTSSIFGAADAATTSSSVFGAPNTTTNIFSGATPTTGASVFGGQSSSIFGGAPTQKPAENIFAQPAAFGSGFSAATTSQSVFGSGAAATTQSVFGAAAAVSPGSGTTSIFGTPTSTSGSVFGGGTSASSGSFGSGFGSTPVATTSAFGSPAPATQPATQASFGFGGLSVGAGSSGGSIFGGGGTAFGQQQSPAANPFGKPTFPTGTSSGANLFSTPGTPSSSSGTNIFGSPAGTSASAFGGGTQGSTFGNQSGFGSPSTFGSSPAFGQKPTAFSQSGFGNTSFGTPQPGAFSGASGGTPVAQTGFGSPAFQKPASGFGSAPVFGGSPTPAFGGTPAFGAAPAFGIAPVFGSPDKVFGQPTPQNPGTFGTAAAAQPSAGFGNLATQNTIGFGNLAQQANTPQQSMPFSGGGGASSFSSWR